MSVSPLTNPGIIPNPFPVYAALAEKQPVLWCDGLKGWALLKHADCLAVLRDSRMKAERMESILAVKFKGQVLPPDNIYNRFTKNVMMYTDPPLHDSLRQSTAPAFTRAAHEHYRTVIDQVAFDLIASVPEGRREIDAVADLAAKLPVNASVKAFGLPEEDLDFVCLRVNMIMTYWSGPQEQPLELPVLLQALEELHVYSLELVNGNRGKVLPDTVIARLAAAQPTNTHSTPEQTIHQLVLLLIALFAPTTPGSVSSGILSFAENPDQIDRFLSNTECAANAANEVIRYNASNQFTWRVATETVNINGQRIEAGQVVVPFLGAANRDPAVFENPNKFDLERKNSSAHLSFGSGIHSCLGKQIATLQIGSFFHALLMRFPKISLAGAPVWNTNVEFRSLKSLPLRLL